MNQKSAFGLSQISEKQPEFASWIFRGYFIISKAVLGWLAATKVIPQQDLYEIVISITLLADPIMFGLSKMFGIVPEDVQPGQPVIADTQIQDGEPKSIRPIVVDNPVPDISVVPEAVKAATEETTVPPTTWPIPAATFHPSFQPPTE